MLAHKHLSSGAYPTNQRLAPAVPRSGETAIIEAARANPGSAQALELLPVFGGPRQRRQLPRWFAAIKAAQQLPDSELPPLLGSAQDAVPPASRWKERDPVAAERLGRCREVITTLAAQHDVLAQNLLAAEVVRRLAWEPPAPASAVTVGDRLHELGARPWQIELTASLLATALGAA